MVMHDPPSPFPPMESDPPKSAMLSNVEYMHYWLSLPPCGKKGSQNPYYSYYHRNCIRCVQSMAVR
jgi:hypothetical protein